ncbi:MAG: extracellular solute-binding protein [Mycobacteriales bacterium]
MRAPRAFAIAAGVALIAGAGCTASPNKDAPAQGSNSAAGTSAASGGPSSPASSAASAATTPAGATGKSSAAAPAESGTCTASGPLSFQSGGDVNIQDLWQKTLLPEFKKFCPKVKVTFTFDVHSTNANLSVAKVAAALKQGKSPGVDLTDDFSTPAAQAGLTEKVSPATIPQLGKVNQQALAAYKSMTAPYRGSSVLLAYDSSQIDNPPKTLADLLTWIKDNKGAFTYNDPSSGGSGDAFVQTVVASKLPAATLKSMQTAYTPALEKLWTPGLQVLKGLTPDIYQKVYPKGNQAVLDLLGKGEIQMAPVWSDQFLAAQKQGLLDSSYKVTQISDPSFTGGAAYISIIKNTKHAAAAATFINWVLQPDQQAEIVKTISGFPAIPLGELPTDAQSILKGVDTQALRPGFESKFDADLQNKWASVVP